jgi:hypothetical protein
MKLKPFNCLAKTGIAGLSSRAISGMLIFVAGVYNVIAAGLAQTDVMRIPGAGETIGPKIEVASPIFDFGKVKQGEFVRHEFVIKNSGSSTLEITAVNPGCGCTTPDNWDKRVEPGKTGVIALQFNSAGFSGSVAKTATVTSNDPQATIVLQIKGDVWTPFFVSPKMALFNVSSETATSETKVIRIVSQVEQPVTLTGVEGTNAAFRTELTTVNPGKEFELKITSVPPFGPSSISAPVTVKTSASEAPTISVLAQLIVQQAVVATPERIILPSGPLTGTTTTVLTVRNNGKDPLALSDPKINISGGEVTVKDVQPGKLFHVSVTFPTGFEVTPAKHVEVSLKSNHSKFAVIRVPVVMLQPQGVSATNVTGVAPP